MLRTELLRAKSVQAEVSYLTEMKQLREVRGNEQQKNAVMREKERQFWHEAVRSHGSDKAQGASQGANKSAHMDRMWQAHSQLKDARAKHEVANRQLQEGIARFSTCQQRVEALNSMLAKSLVRRANRIESRRSEDMTELVMTSRAVAASRQQRARAGEDTGLDLEDRGKDSTGNEVPQSWMNPSVGVTLVSTIAQPAESTPSTSLQTPSVSVIGPLQGASPVQVQTVQVSQESNQKSLSIQCSMGAHGQVNLSLIKREGEGIHVVVQPTGGALAGALNRDKSMILSRVQALGIKVGSIEVGNSDEGAIPGYEMGLKRRKRGDLFEESDEDDNA